MAGMNARDLCGRIPSRSCTVQDCPFRMRTDRYLREHEFTPEEIVGLVWEAARILDQRPAPGAET